MAGETRGGREDPRWSALLGWPLLVAVLAALLLAPLAVKLAVSRPPAPAAEGRGP